MHGMRISGFCHMTSPFCNLIGAWKFLSAGPRILPKFTRPFSGVGSGHETKQLLENEKISQVVPFLLAGHKLIQ